MDVPSVAAYDVAASEFAREWLAQPAPQDMYDLLARHFKPGGASADIGCGAGRDTAWLAAHGYPATGYDPSAGLLEEARAAWPQLHFVVADLPELACIADGAFDNVLCETVIMHLAAEHVGAATARLGAILKSGGTLYLSWRVASADQRDKQGRLYAAFDAAAVRSALPAGRLLLNEGGVSASSGKKIHRLVFRKA